MPHGFLQARDMGVAVKKWIVVNIQNVSEFSCQCLNRDVWSNAKVKEIIRENFLFLQVTSPISHIPSHSKEATAD